MHSHRRRSGVDFVPQLSSVVKGHLATLYERHGFGGGIGAGIGIVSNETYFLEKQWNVNMSKSRPIVSKKMARHDWKTRQVQGEAPIGDYKAKFGLLTHNPQAV
jgi:salicylate hydroxylase